MALLGYREAARQHVSELAALLSDEDREQIHVALKEVGDAAQVESALLALLPSSLELLALSPSRRSAALRRFERQGERRIQTYAALVWAQRAANLLAACEAHDVEPGGPYRAMTRRAAEAAAGIPDKTATLWPLPGPSPFET